MAGYLRITQTAARAIDEVFATAGRLDEYRPYQTVARRPRCSRVFSGAMSSSGACRCPLSVRKRSRAASLRLEITAPLRWHLVARQRQPGSPMRCRPRRRIRRRRPSPRRCSGPSRYGCARRGTAGWRRRLAADTARGGSDPRSRSSRSGPAQLVADQRSRRPQPPGSGSPNHRGALSPAPGTGRSPAAPRPALAVRDRPLALAVGHSSCDGTGSPTIQRNV